MARIIAHARGAVLELEVARLAVARRRARRCTCRRRASAPRDHAVVEVHAARDVGRVVAVDEQRDVEVAVADVAQDRAREAVLVEVGARAQDVVGQRETGTATSVVERARARAQGARGVVGAGGGRPTSARRSSSSVAHSKPVPPCSAAICSVVPACAATSSGVPWNSRKSVGATAWSRSVVAVDGLDQHLVEQLDARDRDRRSDDRRARSPPRRAASGRRTRPPTSPRASASTRSVTSQTTPSVPSEPMNSRVRS